MNLNSSDGEGFDDPFVQASYDAFKNSETDSEALNTLAFTAGVDVEQAIKNLCRNSPEVVVRFGLTGILLGMLDAGRDDMVLTVFQDMANFAVSIGYGAGE